MSDDQRRGLVADLTRRLALASHDEIRVVDRVLDRLERLRFRWERRIPTGEHDRDPKFHLAARLGGGVMTTRCRGSWPLGDMVETQSAPIVTERCLACQRAAWSGTELDPLISAVLEQLAADDLSTANLREAARAEMVGDG